MDTKPGTSIVLLASETRPLRARSLPSIVALSLAVIELRAKIEPAKVELAPSVALSPTCQKTFDAWAPPSKTMDDPGLVVRVEAI